ncbi:MAG: signal peptide peptidase SppA [Bacteroidales bacterium]|nr:signal peptide peptidase SppA [Bacteroidales bacterium]
MKSFFKTLFATFIGSSIALMVCFFLFLGIIGSIAALGSKESSVSVPASAVLKIDFSQPITERGNEDPFAGLSSLSFETEQKSMALLPALQAIEKAATDPAIKFLYMNLSSINTGMAQLEEIRDAVKRFRESGKAVIAYASNYSQGAYYMATAADKIYIQREGNAMIFGIGTRIMFFKDLLDKLGVEVQLIRHGKFKAAAEQFIASNISEANREQNQEMIDSVWETWTTSICESRDISVEEFNSLVDNLKLGNAESLIENKLVDEAVTTQEMTDKLCSLFGVEKEKDLEMITLDKYAKAVIKPNLKTSDKIAVIYADGDITMSGNEGITASEFCPMISKIKADSSIKAVVLRVNSPGGDAQAAEMINTELQLLRNEKPVIVSFGDYAASGGYWISAKSDYIFTDKTTLTGSIGVFSLMMNVGKGLKKHLNINVAELGTNRHSNMMSGMNPLNESEQAYMQNFVEDVYTGFTELVAEGRELNIDYVDSIAQGRVWTGSEAVDLKLADKIGGITEAIQYAAVFAGLDNYRTVEYPTVKSSIDKLMEMFNGTSAAADILPEPFRELGKAYGMLTEEKGIKNYARVPLIYEFQY